MEKNQLSLYKKLAEVQKNVSRIPKNGYNSFHKYHFVQEADLLDMGRPLLLEHGILLLTNAVEESRSGDIAKVKMEFTLVDIDTGAELKSYYWGEGQDKGDKAIYKAYTGAVKYFLLKMFLVSTGDDAEFDQPNTNNNGHYGNNAPSYPNNSKRQASGQHNASKPNTNGAPQTKKGQIPDNNDTEQIKYFQKLKGKWELYGGDAKSFSGWYANKQKEGLNNEQIYNNFMEQISSREAAKEQQA